MLGSGMGTSVNEHVAMAMSSTHLALCKACRF